MKEITLDGNNMTTIEKTYKYLKIKLNFPSYYGENLDALWDVLSTISETTKISLINCNKLHDNLGDYSKSLVEAFQDASSENVKVNFVAYK